MLTLSNFQWFFGVCENVCMGGERSEGNDGREGEEVKAISIFDVFVWSAFENLIVRTITALILK